MYGYVQTWLAEATITIVLVHADSVYAGRGLALVKRVLAVHAGEAALAVAPELRHIAGAGGTVLARGGAARVHLLLAVLARVPWNRKRSQNRTFYLMRT